ncbi:hypothetical protein Tco_1564204 [Tanacetum coccineum]
MLVDDLAQAAAIHVYPIDLSSRYLYLDYDWIRGIVRTRNRGKVISPIPLTRIVYHDLYLGGKVLVERENVGFDLTKSDLCPSFVKDLTAKGVGLGVADSHTSKHREDGFTPLETIQRLLGISRSKSYSSSKGRPSSQRGGFMIRVVEENERIHKDMELKRRSKFKLKASRHLSTVLAITQSYELGFS